LVRLDARSFAVGDRYPRRDWEVLMRESLGRGPAHILVAQSAGELVGAIVVARFRGDDAANLMSIAVSTGRRRSGIARRLITEAVGLLPNAVHILTLEVRTDNAPARALYEQLGFEAVGTLDGYYGDGTAAVEYTVTLAALRQRLAV
jgi:ribosomal-protein-alanine N-acetyltransferase